MTMRVRFLPLAITRSDEQHGCVGAVTSNGKWFRPQPVFAHDVDGPLALYQYGSWYEADFSPATDLDARSEDHELEGPVSRVGRGPAGDDLRQFLGSLAEPRAISVLDGVRSLMLTRARVHTLYLKRSTGRRLFLRCVFSDGAGERFDWIIPEVALGHVARRSATEDALDPTWTTRFIEFANDVGVYLTLALTKPNQRFPGKFGGCHPLVVGLHTVPSYSDAIDA